MPEGFVILFEDDDILAAAKLGPLPVQADASGDASLQDLLAALLSEREGRGVFLEAAHRLDRRTSGVVLFGKSRKAVSALDAAFRNRRIDKCYWAVPDRVPPVPEARLTHRLVRDPRSNRTLAVPVKEALGPWSSRVGAAVPRDALRPDLAVLDHRTIGHGDRYDLIELHPWTGRTHQIRAQLAAAGCPIRGDLKYGARRSCRNGMIMLHARTVDFEHPGTGERLVVTAPCPADEPLWQAFASQT
ncbi:MAG: RluA family pseudouridine synthase [Treponema sp.]|nr:RluA family pseudouridine synthase [Treponema sp.]